MCHLRLRLLVLVVVLGPACQRESTTPGMDARSPGDAAASDAPGGDLLPRMDAAAHEASDSLASDAADAGTNLPGCISVVPPLPDDGCQTPPVQGCLRECGPELDVMCCRGGDRCLQRTPNGCEYIRSCGSWTDGPCAYHGGPAVPFCGQSFTTGYSMRWDPAPPPLGWTCSLDGLKCPASPGTGAPIRECRDGRWNTPR
jgi:hypothetical protein